MTGIITLGAAPPKFPEPNLVDGEVGYSIAEIDPRPYSWWERIKARLFGYVRPPKRVEIGVCTLEVIERE